MKIKLVTFKITDFETQIVVQGFSKILEVLIDMESEENLLLVETNPDNPSKVVIDLLGIPLNEEIEDTRGSHNHTWNEHKEWEWKYAGVATVLDTPSAVYYYIHR